MQFLGSFVPKPIGPRQQNPAKEKAMAEKYRLPTEEEKKIMNAFPYVRGVGGRKRKNLHIAPPEPPETTELKNRAKELWTKERLRLVREKKLEENRKNSRLPKLLYCLSVKQPNKEINNTVQAGK